MGRTRMLLSSNDRYLESATAQHVDVSKLSEVTEHYEAVAKKLDEEMIQLSDKRSELEKRIQEADIKSGVGNERNVVVSMAVISEQDGDFEITLDYSALHLVSLGMAYRAFSRQI
jgi:hypothetical protein